MMSEALTELSSTIGEAVAGKVLASEIANGELTLTTDPESVIGLLTFLRDDPRCAFVALTDISGVDWPAAKSGSMSSITFCRPLGTCVFASSLR